jgi:hypothetical protein
MAKDIVYVLAMFKRSCNGRQVTWTLAMDCRNIKRAYERQRCLDTNQDFFGSVESQESVLMGCVKLQSSKFSPFGLQRLQFCQMRKMSFEGRLEQNNMKCMLPTIFKSLK